MDTIYLPLMKQPTIISLNTFAQILIPLYFKILDQYV